jgi:hypothetical protein
VNRLRAALGSALLGVCLLATGAPPAAAEPAASPGELLDRIEKAWRARDTAAYLELWSFPSVEAREEERGLVEERLTADESVIDVQRPSLPPGEPAPIRLKASAQVFTAAEPRGRVEQWLFTMERRGAGWLLTGREDVGLIDGLVHLSLDPQGYRADGLTLRFDDFTLEMHRGTLFTAPVSVGPTALLFVGEGVVHFRPWLETEREQLRQFAGKPELVDRVKAAFVRIHPADLYRVLSPARLEPEPGDWRRPSGSIATSRCGRSSWTAACPALRGGCSPPSATPR